MRTFQVLTLTLCLVVGLYLLLLAPAFFLVDRWNPAQGLWLDAHSARLLGLGLLCIALAGRHFLRLFDKDGPRRPSAGWQRRNFALILAALALIGLALARGEAGPNPDYRQPGLSTPGRPSP